MFRDHLGRLWVGTEKGPAVFENDRLRSNSRATSGLSGPISAIGETRDGAILLAVARESGVPLCRRKPDQG